MRALFFSVVLFCVAGCSNMNIKQIADSISDIADGKVPSNLGTYSNSSSSSSSSVPSYSHSDQQYVNKTESFNLHGAKRQKNERGLIRSLKYENNPKGMTMVRFLGYHQDSGADMSATTYIYKIDGNGWLNNDAEVFSSANAGVVNSGKYYLKSESAMFSALGHRITQFYVSGEISLKRGVTNIVSLEME